MSALQEVADHVGTPQPCTICGMNTYEGGMQRVMDAYGDVLDAWRNAAAEYVMERAS